MATLILFHGQLKSGMRICLSVGALLICLISVISCGGDNERKVMLPGDLVLAELKKTGYIFKFRDVQMPIDVAECVAGQAVDKKQLAKVDFVYCNSNGESDELSSFYSPVLFLGDDANHLPKSTQHMEWGYYADNGLNPANYDSSQQKNLQDEMGMSIRQALEDARLKEVDRRQKQH